MRFVAGPLNRVLLDDILHEATESAIQVRAAVAYADGSKMDLFDVCKKAGKPLTFYGRYDYSIPVHTEVLRWFLVQKSPDFICKLVPDILHSKVIWWEGAGVYIGSANLTGRAWQSNIEAGVYVEQRDLDAHMMEPELFNFFAALDAAATELNEPLYQHICELRNDYSKALAAISAARKSFDSKRKIGPNPGLTYVSTLTTMDKRRAAFLREWNATLKTMHDIADRVSATQHCPSWVSPGTPKGLHADQFLHAYYYQKVKQGNSYPYNQLFTENCSQREAALAKELKWWKSGVYDHEAELAALQRAPRVQSHLSKEEILNLDKEAFTEVGSSIYAMRDYTFRQPPVNIGLGPEVKDYELKAEAFARTQYDRRSQEGKSILETIYFVLYGHGGDADIASRIWEAAHDPKWKIAGMGLSTLGEIVGWGLPDRFPPRNGRTSKALRALGNDVNVWDAM